jgi:hypothetical protein
MADRRANKGNGTANTTASVERRRHPRAATSFSADLVVDGNRHAARVINLSMGGALLDFRDGSPRPSVAVGARLSVEIRCRAVIGTFASEGKAVLWNTTVGPEPLLAIQFDSVTGEAADTLEDLLAEAVIDLGRLRLRDLP